MTFKSIFNVKLIVCQSEVNPFFKYFKSVLLGMIKYQSYKGMVVTNLL